MAETRLPIMAGLGGAVLAALFVPGLHPSASAPTADAAAAKTAQVQTAEKQTYDLNEQGPWFALCEEFALDDYEKPGVPVPEEDTGLLGAIEHEHPPEALDDVTEISRPVPGKSGEKEKFAVRHHLLGYLPACVPATVKLQVLIATVPDPEKTEMRLDFDREIEAIQAAARHEGYAYTHYWFPWQKEDESQQAPADAESALRRRQEPGILVFHRSDGQRLIVFLVGETATSGLSRIQMAHAVDYQAQLSVSGLVEGESSSGKVRIIGPDYSASLQGLRDLILGHTHIQAESSSKNRAVDYSPYYVVLSGVANSSSAIGDFRKYVDSRQASFMTLSLPSCDMLDAEKGYLTSIGYRENQIAHWYEDESGYSTYETAPDPQPPAQNPTPADRAGCPEVSPKNSPDQEKNDLELTFPRELSTLREQSDKVSDQILEAGKQILGSAAGGPVPTHIATATHAEQDTPTNFAVEQQSEEADLALRDSIALMRTRGIKAVIIDATNPLDRLYLLEYLHDNFPTARVLLTDGDEMEATRPHFIDFSGTISASSLPALPYLMATYLSTSKGAKPDRQNISFRSSRQEGDYVATRWQLEGYGNPEVSTASPNPDCYPVSILGEDRFFQANYLWKPQGNFLWQGAADPKELVYPCVGNPHLASLRTKAIPPWRPVVPMALTVLLVVVLGIGGLHAFSLWSAHKGKDWLLTYPLEETDCRRKEERLFHLLVVNNQVFLLHALAVAAGYRYGGILLHYVSMSPLTWGWFLPILATNVIAAFLWALHSVWLAATCGWILNDRYDEWASTRQGLAFSIWCLWTRILSPVRGVMGWVLLTRFGEACLRRGRQLGAIPQRCVPKSPPEEPLANSGQLLLTQAIMLVFAILFVILTLCTFWHLPVFRHGQIFFLARGAHLLDGVSPVIPFFSIFAAYLAWGWTQLRRQRWVQTRKVNLLFDQQKEPVLHALVDDLHASMETGEMAGLVPNVALAVTLLGAFAIFPLLAGFDTRWFQYWFLIWGYGMLLLLIFFTCYQAWLTWSRLEKILVWLDRTPVSDAFAEVRTKYEIEIRIWNFGKTKKVWSIHEATIACMKGVATDAQVKAAEDSHSEFVQADNDAQQVTEVQLRKINKRMDALLPGAIDRMVKRDPSDDLRGRPSSARLYEYLALRFTALARYALLQIGTLMSYLAYGFVLVGLSILFYPFQGRKVLSDILTITFIALLIWIAWMLTRFQRNGALSRLEGSEPGVANYLQVALHVATVGGIPLLALASALFPSFSQFAFSWLRPLLSAVH